MQWQEIRKHYPHQWLLIEAIKAHTENDKRILDEISVVGKYPDSIEAMKSYAQLHRQAPEWEFYVFHTDRQEIEIMERRWLGIRGTL